MKRTFEAQAAADDKRLTIAELKAFLAQLDGIDEQTTTLKARVNLSGHIRSVKVETDG